MIIHDDDVDFYNYYNRYPVPAAAVRIAAGELWEEEVYDAVQKHLEDFYDEVFHELSSYGEIEDMIVADNVSEHMLGNIYVKYFMEEDAEKALQKLTGKYYGIIISMI